MPDDSTISQIPGTGNPETPDDTPRTSVTPVTAEACWYLIEIPRNPPKCAKLTGKELTRLGKRAGAILTPLSYDPLIITGEINLIAYQLGDIGFHKVKSDYFTAAVRELPGSEIPDGLEAGQIPTDEIRPGVVIAANGGYRALRHVFSMKTARGGRTVIELLKSGDAVIKALEDRYAIENDRTLKRSPSGLSYIGDNYRQNGDILEFTIGHQDMLKSHGQSEWHEASRIGLDVERKHLTLFADYLRAQLGQCSVSYSRIDGLGPVKVKPGSVDPLTDAGYTVVFVGTSGSFETATGKPRPDIYSDVRGKPGLALFGLGSKIPRRRMKAAYREFFKLLDCVPGDPGVCAAPVGVLILTPASALSVQYRVITYTYCKSDSGKTSFEKLLLSTQSPDVRGYSNVPVTISARPARRGGSTTNGNMMHLQYAGGFRALVDDYTTANMGPQTEMERGEGLSILVGSLEGQPPAKQTWNRSGPDFAQTFSPQSSFAINGEITCTDEESVINRLIELHGPDEDFTGPGGYDSKLMLRLDTDTSGNLRHAAFCDLARFTLAQPETAEDAYNRACEITAGWEDVGDTRMRARYAIALAGLMLAVERARSEYGLDETARLPALGEALHKTARAQYERIAGAADLPGTLRRLITEALADGAVSFPGPPELEDNGDPRTAWSEPLFFAQSDAEEPVSLPMPDFISSRTQLGMSQGTNGWVPGSCVAGYFEPPKHTGKKSAYSYRIQMYPKEDHLGRLARALNKRTGNKLEFTKELIREILLSSDVIAKPGNAGGLKGNKFRTIDINVEWLFASESEDE